MSEIIPINDGLVQDSQELQNQMMAQEVDNEVQIKALDQNDRVDLTDKFATYKEFATSYPKLNKAMMDSIANNIINDLKHHQERMKQIMKENR
jgi:hypothetical protein